MEASEQHSSGAASDRSGVWCIVVAGGSGRRFGGAKQFVLLGGRTVLDRSIEAAATACAGIVVVVPAEAVEDVRNELPRGTSSPVAAVVAGGATRAGSVRAGLAAVPADAVVVLVHDAARPLASASLFTRVRDAVRAGADAVVPAVAVTDTIRRVGGGVVDRDDLRAVQTPQGFRSEVLRAVHRDEPEATDDAGLVERAGGAVTLVEGERSNLKITDPADLVVAQALLDQRAQVAAGAAAGRDSAP